MVEEESDGAKMLLYGTWFSCFRAAGIDGSVVRVVCMWMALRDWVAFECKAWMEVQYISRADQVGNLSWC